MIRHAQCLPREGVNEPLNHGGEPTAPTDVELLAALVGGGARAREAERLAASLLTAAGGLRSLSTMSVPELRGIAGIGRAAAVRISAGLELGARALSIQPNREPLIESRQVFELYGRPLSRSRVEHFVVIAVDAKNRPLRRTEVARGGRSSCPVDPTVVFRALVSDSASGAIFVHNHPSGDPAPSRDDLVLTERLVAGGRLLDIRVLNHLIVGHGRYTSLRDARLLPNLE